MGKLITGWWEELGLDIQYSVEDNGMLIDGGYNYAGDTYKPDYDMYIWAWQPSGSDPGRRLGYFRTVQIENQNDACWSNKEYDAALGAAVGGARPAEAQGDRLPDAGDPVRGVAVHRASRTPSSSRRGTRRSWEGWQRIPQPNGAVAYISDNVSNYYKVAPKAAETTPESSGSSMTWVIVVVVGRGGRGRHRHDRPPAQAEG